MVSYNSFQMSAICILCDFLKNTLRGRDNASWNLKKFTHFCCFFFLFFIGLAASSQRIKHVTWWQIYLEKKYLELDNFMTNWLNSIGVSKIRQRLENYMWKAYHRGGGGGEVLFDGVTYHATRLVSPSIFFIFRCPFHRKFNLASSSSCTCKKRNETWCYIKWDTGYPDKE